MLTPIISSTNPLTLLEEQLFLNAVNSSEDLKDKPPIQYLISSLQLYHQEWEKTKVDAFLKGNVKSKSSYMLWIHLYNHLQFKWDANTIRNHDREKELNYELVNSLPAMWEYIALWVWG
jgi:hypothetical protein